MDWRARARTARARACGPRPRGCARTRAGARSRTQARPPPTRRKRVRAARMRYRDSTVHIPLRRPITVDNSPVMRGQKRGEDARKRAYAPRIYPLRKKSYEDRWIAGSSPAMTTITASASALAATPSSLSQPFEQRRNVDLVGLVVAGERVHHDVDAGAEREFALARLGGDERQHGLAVLAHRPGAGEIVRRDDDRRHAVAGARRAARRLVFVDGGQRLHPQLAGAEAAGKVLQQVEGLGQHVVAPHRLELGDVE